MNWLRKLVLHNWWAKLLALGLACALWLTVANAPPAEAQLAVPLQLENVPPGLRLVSDVPTHVQVTVRASANLLQELPFEQLVVTVDLKGFGEGNHRYRFSSHDVQLPPGIDVVRITPAELRLELVVPPTEPESAPPPPA